MSKTLKHVLCVDDDQDILDVAQLSLETVAGLQVTALTSGVAAVAHAATIAPDFILLDVMMPVMDGPTTLTTLRQNPALQNTPIAFMTARVQSSEVEEYFSIGANGVVPKPFDPMALSSQIEDIYNKFHKF